MGRSSNSFTGWVGQANILGARVLTPEERLFIAVLSQAVHDAFSIHVPTFERNQAQAWLTGNSKDFRAICEHSGRDAGYVLEKIRDRILVEEGWNVNLSTKTPPQRLKQMKNYRRNNKHLVGNAYYAAKRAPA